MSCKKPLKAWQIGLHDSGKPKYYISSYDVNFIYQRGDSWMIGKHPFFPDYFDRIVRDYLLIPCGKCLACRLDYTRQWAERLLLEQKCHDSSYFITLTYDDDHVPIVYYDDPATGEAFEGYTLVKSDVQKFFKRLRKVTGQKLRYYYCGEYGPSTFRPHYHLIVFGLKLDDLKYLKKDKAGNPVFISDLITREWPFGMHAVGEVTFESCAYVARYVMKKLDDNLSSFYEAFNCLPEYCNMSRRPGIGREYYEQHKDKIYLDDKIILSTKVGGKVFRPPRYYDKLYDLEYPEQMSLIKDHRRVAAEALQEAKLRGTSLNYIEYCAVELENLQKRTNILKEREKFE